MSGEKKPAAGAFGQTDECGPVQEAVVFSQAVSGARTQAGRKGQTVGTIGEQVLESSGGIGVGEETGRVEVLRVSSAADDLGRGGWPVGVLPGVEPDASHETIEHPGPRCVTEKERTVPIEVLTVDQMLNFFGRILPTTHCRARC